MLWRPYAVGSRREHGFDVDALVTVCSWNTNVIMIWAWMLWETVRKGVDVVTVVAWMLSEKCHAW